MLFRAPKVATRPRRHLAIAMDQVISTQMVPSIGTHIHDLTELAKCPPEKQFSSHWAVETLCMLSVATAKPVHKMHGNSFNASVNFCTSVAGHMQASS